MEIFNFFQAMRYIQTYKVPVYAHASILLEMNEKFRASLKESGITDSTISTLIVQDILSKDILSSLNDEEFKLLQCQLTVGQVCLLRLYKNKVNELTPSKVQSGE